MCYLSADGGSEGCSLQNSADATLEGQACESEVVQSFRSYS